MHISLRIAIYLLNDKKITKRDVKLPYSLTFSEYLEAKPVEKEQGRKDI